VNLRRTLTVTLTAAAIVVGGAGTATAGPVPEPDNVCPAPAKLVVGHCEYPSFFGPKQRSLWADHGLTAGYSASRLLSKIAPK
jgi:hypothetical protein